MTELCELMTYKFYEQDDVIHKFKESYDDMHIILDGKVEFTTNLFENNISDKDVLFICKDL